MRTRGIRRSLLTLALLATAPAARGQEPLSAIDWLSKSVSTPAAPAPAAPAEPAVTKNAMPGAVSVTVIGAPSPDGTGLLPAARTGLPHALWGLTPTADLAAAVTAAPEGSLPALQSLLITLLLAEADPPVDATPEGALLLARIDKLLAMGALDQAAALVEGAGLDTPDLFRRRFDIALLTGQEDLACEAMQGAPHLAPTLAARIFCMARAGDWNAAALTLETTRALGQVDAAEDRLLTRFLDVNQDDAGDLLPPPQHPTPLIWRIYEAIGEPLSTAHLPVAFAHAELRPQAGWKAQIEAAERLARAGAIAPNLLLGIYTERDPAASGGVWDRVQAFQRFDAALAAVAPGGSADAVATALPAVWTAMEQAELEVPFAALYGERLQKLALTGEPARLALRIGLLSPQYRSIGAAARPAADDLQMRFLVALSQGDLAGQIAPDAMARAVQPAFVAPQPAPGAAPAAEPQPAIAPEAEALLAERRHGEAVLMALAAVAHGAGGDPRGVAAGLSLLRRLGQEDTARRAALELLLLDRRG